MKDRDERERDERDEIVVQDSEGHEKEYAIEALFDLENHTYALLAEGDDVVLMRVEEDEDGDQFLVGLDDPQEAEMILDAYQIAVEAAPAE